MKARYGSPEYWVLFRLMPMSCWETVENVSNFHGLLWAKASSPVVAPASLNRRRSRSRPGPWPAPIPTPDDCPRFHRLITPSLGDA